MAPRGCGTCMHTSTFTQGQIWVKVPQCHRRLSATVDTHEHPWDSRVTDWETWCQGDTAPHSVPAAQPWSSAGTHHKQRPNRDTVRCSDTSFSVGSWSQPAQSRQRGRAVFGTHSSRHPSRSGNESLGLRPTSSYTNILRGVTVAHRHGGHARGLTRHGPTRARPPHGDPTRQGRADRRAGGRAHSA